MAFQLENELPTGATGNYWRVNWLSLDRGQNSATVIIGLYLSKDARDSGKQPLMEKTYKFYGEDYAGFDTPAQDAEDANVIRAAYDAIKTDSDGFFASATDV